MVGRLVAVSTRTSVSDDGVTWTNYAAPGGLESRALAYSPTLDIFCVLSGADAATSSDGVTWTTHPSAVPTSTWKDMCWSPQLELFVAVADSIVPNPAVATSPDGVNWTARATSGENEYWSSIVWSPQLGKFCATASAGTYRTMTSWDGITWTVSTNAGTPRLESLAWSRGLGVFASIDANSGNFFTSSDGITWTSTAPGVYLGEIVQWSEPLGLFVTMGTLDPDAVSQPLRYSSDGVTWSTGAITNYANEMLQIYDIQWNKELGLFCAVGHNQSSFSTTSNLAATSPDGINWTIRDTGATTTLYALAVEDPVYTESQNLFPDAIIEQTNLKGELSTIQQDPAESEFTGMSVVEWTLPTALQVGFPALSSGGKLYGTQTIGIDVILDSQMTFLRTTEDQARALKSITMSAYLYEDGVNRGLLQQWVMSDDGTGEGVRYFDWDASLLSKPDPDVVEFRLEGTADSTGTIAPLIFAVMMTSNYIPSSIWAAEAAMGAVANVSVESTVTSSGQVGINSFSNAVIRATREVLGEIEPVIARADILIDEYAEYFTSLSMNSRAYVDAAPTAYSGTIPMAVAASIDISENITYYQSVNIGATGQADFNSIVMVSSSASMQGYFHIVIQGHYFTPGLIRADVVDSSRPTVLSEKLDTLMLNWSVSQATGSRELVDE